MMRRFCLGLILFFLFGPHVAFAVPKVEGPDHKEPPQQVTYRVKKGDSLYRIARKAGISVHALMRLNDLSTSKIKPGQVLLLRDLPALDTGEATLNFSPSVLVEIENDCALLSPLLESPVLHLLAAPYRFGGTSADGIDCSGFVQLVFKEFNFDLPRSVREQYRLGIDVPVSDLQIGDLLFFRTYAKYPSHVGIYLGHNKMIHASATRRKVVVSNIRSSYFRTRYIGAKRFEFNLEGLNFESMLSGVPEEPEEDAKEGGEDEAVVERAEPGV